MDDALSDLYQSIILSHNRRPRNEREMEPCSGKAEGYNPMCGDKVTVFVNEVGGRLDDVSFVGEGCAISRASASIMTERLKGLGEEEARARIAEVYALLTSEEEPEADLERQGELAALIGVRRFPARIKCATLAWHALEDALDGKASG